MLLVTDNVINTYNHWSTCVNSVQMVYTQTSGFRYSLFYFQNQINQQTTKVRTVLSKVWLCNSLQYSSNLRQQIIAFVFLPFLFYRIFVSSLINEKAKILWQFSRFELTRPFFLMHVDVKWSAGMGFGAGSTHRAEAFPGCRKLIKIIKSTR